FIDEIDSIAGARDRDVRESHGLLNQLLSSIDGVRPWEVPILVLGATNLPGQVDPALTRPGRLDEVLQIDLPNANARRNLLESRLRSLDPGVDLQAVAIDTTGCTPAEIDRIAREAIYRSLSEKRATVSSSDLDHARRLVLLGLGATDLEVTEDERRLAAFHEAGHVVAFRELFPDRRIDFVSILPSEQGAIGAVLSSRRRERSPAAEDVRKELVVLLAGRAAEALSGLPAPTAAAATDLEQATALVQRAVGEWGFDEEIGPVHLDRSRAPQPQLNASWQRVRSWLVEADERAKKLVTDRLGEVATVAERLRAEESLDGRAIGELLRNLAE
ncbi:MAG: AAA family ATPase, partial [Thermoanaerobaculia bacterium]|nr:AAA family ATPase [Thermoanaerobaculia bacterium]